MKIGIIGGGASGIICAIKLKSLNKNYDVTILEKEKAIGKKLRVTGNGRCNLGNRRILDESYNNEIISNLVRENFSKLMSFFEQMGLLVKEENEGRLYPFNESAEAFAAFFSAYLEEYKVKILLEEKVLEFKKEENGFLVRTEKSLHQFDYLILACGGKSYFKEENTDILLRSLKKENIDCQEFRQGLSGLKISEDILGLSGLRLKTRIKVFYQKKPFYEEKGEIIFKDEGINGIVIMNISSIIARSQKDITDFHLELDFSDGMGKKIREIYQKKKDLKGILPEKLLKYLQRKKLSEEKIIESLFGLRFSVKGFYDFKNAQVSIGGISAEEINLQTMELKKVKKLFVLGEVIDADGLCGGYNLMWAFITGLKAAEGVL